MYKQSESRASLAVSGCETRGEAIAESDFLEWSGVPRVPRRRDWGGSGPLNHAWSEWLVYFAPNFQESCKYCYDFPQNSPEKNFKLQPVKRMNIFYLVISLCFFFPLGLKKCMRLWLFFFWHFLVIRWASLVAQHIGSVDSSVSPFDFQAEVFLQVLRSPYLSPVKTVHSGSIDTSSLETCYL